MHRIRIGVLRGGPSNEYDVSLKTGATVLNNLSHEKYNIKDILIDRNGLWHMQGVPRLPHDVLSNLDVVFNALHGEYGEDGKVQHILETHGIPYTGSNSFSSAIGMNKQMSKEVYKKNKIKTPGSILLDSLVDFSKNVHEIFRKFPLPMIIKPTTGGSSFGVELVHDYSYLDEAIKKAFEHSRTVLIEEYIKGKEATCGVIDDYRGKEFYTLPPIEIRPHGNRIFDYDAKYAGKSDEIVPGNFGMEEKSEIEELAIMAHRALGMRHYSRSDFIIHPSRGIFILETNSLPGLTKESLIPKALHAVGATISHFVDHVVGLALRGK
ncbi:MAG: D-alanine--D-alanine ligase [Patescibacteria group bacterium]